MYKAGQREMYGIRFPEGLRENQMLRQAIVTPTTKAFGAGHDEPLSARDIAARGLMTASQWQTTSDYALALFAHGQRLAASRGLILVDTKYEFGLDAEGRVTLADEIHTPDSSRYWIGDSYERRFAAGEPPEPLDKDFLRRWVTARCDPYRDPIPEIPREIIFDTALLYITAFETITGKQFQLPSLDVPILSRIRSNLAQYF